MFYIQLKPSDPPQELKASELPVSKYDICLSLGAGTTKQYILLGHQIFKDGTSQKEVDLAQIESIRDKNGQHSHYRATRWMGRNKEYPYDVFYLSEERISDQDEQIEVWMIDENNNND